MIRARWRDRMSPPSVVAVTALLTAALIPPAIHAGALQALVPAPGCATLTAGAVAGWARADSAGRPQVTVEAVTTRRGEWVGRTVTTHARAGRAVQLSLPAESFVSRPTGDVVVFGSHGDSLGSQVSALDLGSGCVVALASPLEVVRSAVLDQSATALFVHRVRAADRADLGVMRIELDSGAASEVLAPLPPSDRFGPTFATELAWSVDGSALAVQSCGFGQCRTRILDIASGGVTALEDEGQGGIVGLSAAALITFAACPGVPCAVLAIDRQGVVETLAEAALAATLEPAGGGSAVVRIETAAGTVEVLR